LGGADHELHADPDYLQRRPVRDLHARLHLWQRRMNFADHTSGPGHTLVFLAIIVFFWAFIFFHDHKPPTKTTMTISERWHQIVLKFEELFHINPGNAEAISAKKNEIATLANHPDVPPETKAAVASVSDLAADTEITTGPQPVYDGQPRIPDFVNPPPQPPVTAPATPQPGMPV
jgi:hypothetical protein